MSQKLASSVIPSRHRAVSVGSVVCALALFVATGAGCGGGEEGGTGSGGQSPGAGGAVGAGGRTGTGGATGTGGTTASGGTRGSGGATGSGGTTASGGASASGGAPGGAPGSGGSGSAGARGGAGGSGTGGGPGGRGGSGGSGSGGAGTAGMDGMAMKSIGCGRTPMLRNSPSATANYNMISSGGATRQYLLRRPDNYDNNQPYRLILGLHGATGTAREVAPSYFGLFNLAGGSIIFVSLEAVGGLWSAEPDTQYAKDVLRQVEEDLCIDLARVNLEGFSQGAAMSWTLACSMPGVFRAVIGHSGGGVTAPRTCQAVAYMGSLGLQESSGASGQTMQTDQFARFNGCTIATLPTAPSGGHVCTDYMGCPTGKPVRWCSYDAGHTPSPTDRGQSSSWMPMEAWKFFSQF